MERPHNRVVVIALFCLLGVAVNALILGPDALRLAFAGVNDFRSFYAAAHLVGSDDLYNPSKSLEQQRAAGTVPSRNMEYSRPPYLALALWPLSQLPYPVSHWLWLALSVAALVGFVLLWPLGKRQHLVMAVCWSLPVVMCLFQSQDVPFLLLWVALGTRFWRQGHLFAAGLALSLCAEKYHLFFLLPLLIVRLRLWRLGAGFLTGGAILMSLSFVAGGPHWLQAYVSFLADPHSMPGVEAMPNLGGLAARLGMPAWITVSLILATLAGFWAAARAGFPAVLCLAVAAGVVINIHSFLSDCALLLPAICLVAQSSECRPWLRTYALILLTPLPFVLTFLGAEIVLLQVGLLVFVGLLAYWTSQLDPSGPSSELASA
jgi:hypothetical protein